MMHDLYLNVAQLLLYVFIAPTKPSSLNQYLNTTRLPSLIAYINFYIWSSERQFLKFLSYIIFISAESRLRTDCMHFIKS